MPRYVTRAASKEGEIGTESERKGGDGKLPSYLKLYYSQIYSGSLQGDSITILSRACERPVASGRAIRFEIPNKYLEELSGIRLLKGRLYLISGKIESQFAYQQTSLKFEIYRFVTANLKLRIYLPKEYHDWVISGETYKIVIEAIIVQEAPRNPAGIFSLVRYGGKWSRLSIDSLDATRTKATVNDSRLGVKASKSAAWPKSTRGLREPKSRGGILVLRGLAGQAKWIDWKVVAAWMDTEGYLYTKEGRLRRYELAIRQSEPGPLREIQRFLHDQGIKHLFRKMGYRLSIHHRRSIRTEAKGA